MPKRNRGYILTPKGAKKLNEAKRERETQHGERCTQEKIRDLTRTFKEDGLDTGTIRKILKGEKGVDKESIRCLFSAFSMQLDDDDLEQVKQNDVPNLISSSMKENETGEALMLLATSMLEKLGFNKLFKMTGSLQNRGYRFHAPYDGDKRHQLILFQHEDSLSLCIPHYILEPYLLILKYWIDSKVLEEAEEVIAGKFLVLPSKKDVFLELLHPNYWNLLEVEGHTIGTFYLNEVETWLYGDDHYDKVLPSIILDEFCPENLSNSDTYLILNENKLFPYTWQMCIRSSEVLQEVIIYFGKLLINAAWDQMPF